jgi:hypothetical protein
VVARSVKATVAFSTKASILDMLLMPIVAGACFLVRCDFHFLGSALPTCTREFGENYRIKLTHKPLPELIVYLILQATIGNALNCAIFPYLAIGLTMMVDGMAMIENLIPKK